MARIQPIFTILFLGLTALSSFGQSLSSIQNRQAALDWEGAQAAAQTALASLEGADRLAYLQLLGELPLPNRAPFWQEGLSLMDSLEQGDSLRLFWRWKTGQALIEEDTEKALTYWEGLEGTAYWGEILLHLAKKRPSSSIYLEQAIQFLSREQQLFLLAKAYFLELPAKPKPLSQKVFGRKVSGAFG